MKKNKLIVLPLVALVALHMFGCDKKDKKPFSSWTVNEEKFSTNEVTATIGKAQSGLSSSDASNRFLLAFSIAELPRSGTFDLNTAVPGQVCAINFYYHNKFYYTSPSQVGKIYAAEVNGKARYTLPVTWFVSYENPAVDSIQISGEFNEP